MLFPKHLPKFTGDPASLIQTQGSHSNYEYLARNLRDKMENKREDLE